jgi:tetratricopeptide (TPR) repeat protein
MSLFLWGDVELERGEYARARAQLEESLTLFRKLDDKRMGANPLTGLGRLACIEGDYATGRALVEEALASRRELGDMWNIAISLNSLGEVARCAGDEGAALLFEEALALNRDLGDHAGIGWSLHNLGHVALQASNHQRAATRFAESLTIRRQHDYKAGVAAGLAGIASVALALGQPERAVRLFGAAEALLASIHTVLAPADQLVYDRDVAALRAQLDDATFVKAWAAGHTMKLEEAIAEALVEATTPLTAGKPGDTS